jgi:hypothetical protein
MAVILTLPEHVAGCDSGAATSFGQEILKAWLTPLDTRHMRPTVVIAA